MGLLYKAVILFKISPKILYIFWAAKQLVIYLAIKSQICSRISVTLLLSLIFNSNWILYSSYIKTTLLNNFAFSAIAKITNK